MTPLFMLVLALGKSPGPPACAQAALKADPKKVEAAMAAGFPKVRAGGIQCECAGFEDGCPVRRWTFAPFSYTDPDNKVTFRVDPYAKIEGKGVATLLPLASATQARQLAESIRADPLVHESLAGVALTCDTTASGSDVTWLRCAAANVKTKAGGGDALSESGHTVAFFAVPAAEGGEKTATVRLSAWSLPVAKVPGEAVGWMAARAQSDVSAFITAHPDALADFYRWHSFFLVLYVPGAQKAWKKGGPPPAGQGVVVKFAAPPEWNAVEPGEISSVDLDLKARFKP